MKQTKAILILAVLPLAMPARCDSFMERLERALYRETLYIEGPPGDDYGDIRREWDGLKYYRRFIERSGWTTNQFVEALMFIATNNLSDENWQIEEKRLACDSAFYRLERINLPQVTNFFYAVTTNDIRGRQCYTIPGIIRYTNLEPEIMSYLDSLCAMTNIYDNAADSIDSELYWCLCGLPDGIDKVAATNRVARHLYRAAWHTSKSYGQDWYLEQYFPGYSNSVQRLSLLQYARTFSTNEWTIAALDEDISRLLALPTNELNDVSWLTDE